MYEYSLVSLLYLTSFLLGSIMYVVRELVLCYIEKCYCHNFYAWNICVGKDVFQ